MTTVATLERPAVATAACPAHADIRGLHVHCEDRTGHAGAHHDGMRWWSETLAEAVTAAEQDASGW